MKQALAALEWNLPVIEDYGVKAQLHQQHKAIDALRAAIAEAAMQRLTDVQQEMEQRPAIYPEEARELGLEEIPYYTHPPRREWVGLTEDDLNFWSEELGLDELGKGVLRAVDAHLKEQNS